MKDCRLSEAKKICVKNKFCNTCIFYNSDNDRFVCLLSMPFAWDIDELSEQIADDIIAAVKQIIWNNGTFDEMGEIVTLDGNDIDHIAEMIAEKFCGGEE